MEQLILVFSKCKHLFSHTIPLPHLINVKTRVICLDLSESGISFH